MISKDVLSLSSLDTIDEILDGLSKSKKNPKILDVGCGCGCSVNYLKEKGMDARGVDYSEEIINLGKKTYTGIDLKVMDANNLEFPHNYFDLILFECSLSVMENTKKILSSSINILKEDGLLLISDFFLKESDLYEGVYTMDYWNKLFDDLNLEIAHFQDKSKEWRNYIGMILWEYGDLSVLLRGNQNKCLNKNIFKKETGYFLAILKKRG